MASLESVKKELRCYVIVEKRNLTAEEVNDAYKCVLVIHCPHRRGQQVRPCGEWGWAILFPVVGEFAESEEWVHSILFSVGLPSCAQLSLHISVHIRENCLPIMTVVWFYCLSLGFYLDFCRDMNGKDVPFRDFGYASLLDFLLSCCPETVIQIAGSSQILFKVCNHTLQANFRLMSKQLSKFYFCQRFVL